MSKKRITEYFGKGKKRFDKIRKTFPSPEDLHKGDLIKLLHTTRLVGLDKEAKLIRKLTKDELVTYKGRAKNKLWSNDNIWIKLETINGIEGIVNPVTMVNNFVYEEE